MEIPSNSHLSVRGKEFSCINLLSVVSQCLVECWTNSLDTTINSENCQEEAVQQHILYGTPLNSMAR